MKRPKYIYLVVEANYMMRIYGCFYDEDKAKRYATNSPNYTIVKLEVI